MKFPYQFVVHYIDMTLPDTPLTLSYYADVERSWPSVPRAGDGVSLGGDLIADLAFVEFKDERVRLHFNLTSEEISMSDLESRGLSRPTL